MFLSKFLFVLAVRLIAVVADDQSDYAPPGTLTSAEDPGTVLQPFVGVPDAGDGDTKLIRELLVTRQSVCPGGFGLCSTGGCCPIGGSCCSDGGCCDIGTYCDVVAGVSGCCQDGKVCNSIGGGNGCTDPSYVPCAGDNFCCPAGYFCFRDSSNSPQCSADSTITSTSTILIPTTLTSTDPPPPPPATPTPGDGGNTNGGPSGGPSGPPTSTSLPSNGTSPNKNSNGTNSNTNSNIGHISTSRTSSSSSTESPASSGTPAASLNGAKDWKNTMGFFVLSPLLVLVAVFVL